MGVKITRVTRAKNLGGYTIIGRDGSNAFRMSYEGCVNIFLTFRALEINFKFCLKPKYNSDVTVFFLKKTNQPFITKHS